MFGDKFSQSNDTFLIFGLHEILHLFKRQYIR